MSDQPNRVAEELNKHRVPSFSKPTPILISLLLALFAGFLFWIFRPQSDTALNTNLTSPVASTFQPSPSPTPTTTPTQLAQLPATKVLTIPSHYFQTFNNCGPATLAMTLSYYDINMTQQQLGDQLRPYQNTAGDNDDKSVTLTELADKAEDLGLNAYFRPGGDIELLKKFIANDIPVITRTWTQVNEDIGHYRVVKGYDETTGEIIQDDSLQGKDIRFSYQEFIAMWEKMGLEYLVLAEAQDVPVVEAILGDNLNENFAWQQVADQLRQKISQGSSDIYDWFNLSVALYHLGEYQESISAFERVENQLPTRTLWYQIEPLLAYQELGQYQEVLPRIAQILDNGNRAFSELYQIRGEIYLEQGQVEAARREFELAVLYNQFYQPAQTSLSEIN